MGGQQPCGVADQPGGGLAARSDQLHQHQHRDLGFDVAAVDRRGQITEQVVAGFASGGFEGAVQVAGQLDRRVHGFGQPSLGQHAAEQFGAAVAPLDEPGHVIVG